MDSRGKRAAYLGVVTDDGIMWSSPCIEGNFAMEVETYDLKHGEGKPVCRPLTRKEQEFIDNATRQILSNEPTKHTI